MLATRWDDSDRSVKLNKIDTDDTGGMTEEEGQKRFAHLAEELFDLQSLLYGAGMNGLLVVVQGRDTAGKDGTLKAIAGSMNPVGIRVASFKVPTPEEVAHDFLWRVHRETPGRGQTVFFNRSHYEDVLVARVHKLVPEKVWKSRYAHINQFEELLHDSGIIVVKFYLHISRKEQEQRLLEREKEPAKAWKLNPGDWQERALWDDYTEAYEDALTKCARPHAPWYIVPADHKWFRNVAIAQVLVDNLRPYAVAWQEKLTTLGQEQRKALEQMRAQNRTP